MGKKVSRLSIIFSIIQKDLFEIFRDRLWVYLTALGLVLYVGIYWALPSTIDESLRIGVYQQGMDAFIEEFADEEGLEIVEFESIEELKSVIMGEVKIEEEVEIGIVFSDDFLEKILLGEKPTIQIYSSTDVPKEIRNAMSSFVREIAFVMNSVLSGEELEPENLFPVSLPDEEFIVLGEDRLGDQIAFRDRLIPLLAFIVLMVETMALASIISVEMQTKTVKALLITPVRLTDLMVAKTIFGSLLAFSQVLLVLLLVGAFGQNALILLTFILLGAIMVTGVALISGTAGKDFMGTLLYSMVFLIPLMVPTFSALFPGSPSFFVQLLPTYGLVEGIMRATVYSQGWSDILPYFLMIVVWIIVILGAGLIIFKKRVEKL
jgi:ABC-2 type transport system permease protein